MHGNIDHSINNIWNRLDEKYRAVHNLIDCVLSDIKGLPSCKDSSSSLEMIRLIERAHSDLECIDALNELYNATIISACRVKSKYLEVLHTYFSS